MNIGKKLTSEHKMKIGLAHLGRKLSEETKEKIRQAHIGMKYGEERNLKLSLSQKRIGNKPPSWKGKKHSEEAKNKIREKRKILFKENGFLNTPETRNKISLTLIALDLRGEKSAHWKGGTKKTPEMKLRGSKLYKIWRKHVFNRDRYTCQKCGITNVPLEADHIFSFKLYPDLRFEILNGQTLCQKCHYQTDTYGGKSRQKH